MSESAWRPLLGDELRERALESVDSVARALSTGAWDYRDTGTNRAALADGSAGIALLYAALAERRPEYGARARLELARALDGAATIEMDASLHLGIAGIAWVVEVLRPRGLDQDGDAGDPNEDTDPLLLAYLGAPDPWSGPGILFGLAGIAVYALERHARGARLAGALLERVVARLAEASEAQPAGSSWLAQPRSRVRLDGFPDGFYPTGIDVGAAGILAVLARIVDAGVVPNARALLDSAGAWLLAQRDDRGRIGSLVGPTGERGRAFGWCKGPLGIALAAIELARVTGDPAWTALALQLAHDEARVDPATIACPSLNIGAAGAAHVFNRLAQATGDACCERAAVAWFERTLALREPSGGVAGYQVASFKGAPAARPGLVQGAAGIALALLSAATDIEPRWDRSLGGPCVTALRGPPAAVRGDRATCRNI